ncbi:MAG TPA: AI-2E family transporter [Candidatus Paceibacterota bacterium]|nr:AI-2E family transporter [Candidatus Paceibacterota bacterium]
MTDKDINVHISSGTIIKTILFLILVALLWFLRDIVLIVLTAVVIASAMEPGVHGLMRRRVPRILSVIILYAAVIGAFFGIVLLFLPPVLSDTANFVTQLPTTLSHLNITDATHGLLPWGNVGEALNSADVLTNLSNSLRGSSGEAFGALSAFFGGVTSFILIVVFSFYFSVQETGVDDFLRVITPVDNQVYVLNLWRRSQQKIGKWMQGQLVLALIVGILLYLGLLILDVPHPLLLAVLAGVFELIPVFGQILAMIPAIAIGLVAGGVTEALLVAGLYIIVQQFEAHLIYPVVVKKVVGVPPLLVILSLLIGFQLVGFLGVLLSVPIAGAIQEYVADIDRDKKRVLAKREVGE